MRIYGDLLSGNCYKIKCLLHLLQIPHEWTSLDIMAGETRTPSFLALNPCGKIPLLQEDDGFCLPESNAILCYLAEGSTWLPEERRARARVLQWLFFEQYSHEPHVAVARYYKRYLGQHEHPDLPARHAAGYRALAILEQQLLQTHFLCGTEATVADISLYAYTHVADEGGFDLTPFPALRQWLARLEAMPRFETMNWWLAQGR